MLEEEEVEEEEVPRWSWTSLLLAETGRVLDWLLPIYSLGAKVELQKELMLILMLLMRLLVVATAAAVAGHPTSSSCAEPRANCEPVSANDSVLRSVTHLCASLFGIHIIFGVVMCVPTCTFHLIAWRGQPVAGSHQILRSNLLQPSYLL